ncbi:MULTISPECIES: hypothetical protein [unclassified Akkermansia]|jgi:hypothetical protein|uniref:hypothetical protein n=1 Tax=unclassified Akkermansia TaxID=2608915 RepID=UPI001BFFB24A|nr:hypothetical protein [Akkermansia muciniphila]MBT8775706.1 hypothetical protein [Akkermansia muciniphila]
MLPKISLNEETKQAIARSVGVPVSRILEMDASELDAAIESKIGKKLKLDTKRNRFPLVGRGSVYLALSRFLRFNLDKKIAKI